MNCLSKLEDMPLAPDNQSWVRTEIQNAIDKAVAPLRPPRGWRKALYTLREWGVLAAIITVILTLAIFAATQWNAANKRLADEATFETKTDDRLKAVEASLLILRAARITASPADPKSQQEAKAILAEARKTKLLPVSTAAQTGTAFVDVSPGDPNAWNVALEFVDYLTSLNETPPGQVYPSVSEAFGTRYRIDVPVINGIHQPIPEAYFFGSAPNRPYLLPQNEAARMEPLARPPKQTEPNGIGRFALRGGVIQLDGMYFRHVTLSGVEVHYSGDKVLLQDVAFINCTFKFEDTPQARALATELLRNQARIADFRPTQNFRTPPRGEAP